MANPLTVEQAKEFMAINSKQVETLVSTMTSSMGNLNVTVDRAFSAVRDTIQAGNGASSNIADIKEAAAAVDKCDGVHSHDVREWLKSMTVAINTTKAIPHNVHRIIRKTTSGALYRSLVEYLDSVKGTPAANDWKIIRAFVTNTFLGQNELERLRLELSKCKQGSDNILLFNRKFKEAAAVAFVEPRNPETERMVLRYYATSLHDSVLARRIIVESNAKTLEEAQKYADKMEAGEELYRSLIGDHEPMDCSAVTGQTRTPTDKRIQQQDTKIAKLEAQLAQLQSKPRQQQHREESAPRRNKEVKCYNCKKMGHYQRDCRQPQRPRGPAVHTPRNQGQGQFRQGQGQFNQHNFNHLNY